MHPLMGTQMVESLAVLERKIYVVESEQAKVHAALDGRGNYLGIRDHVSDYQAGSQ